MKEKRSTEKRSKERKQITDLRKKAKNHFEKDFLKLMHNAVFGKTVENERKHRDIKLVTIERRRNYLVSESNYHTTKFFTESRRSSKLLMHEFCYDNVKPKYGEKAKLCYMDTDTVSLHT